MTTPNPQGSGGGVTSDALDALLGSTDGLYAKRVAGAWAQAAAGGTVPLVAQGRLTLVSGDPSPATDQTGKSTLYYTPFNGNRLALYVSSAWQLDTFSEPSIALSGLTSGKNYDVFAYDNAGTVTLELLAWTDDTTRATALARQDGVLVKSGAATRRYLGTIRTTGTTTTEDSNAKRFVFNADNRLLRGSSQRDGSAQFFSFTSLNAWALLNAGGDGGWKHEFVVGLDEDDVFVETSIHFSYDTTGTYLQLGLDSVTAPSASADGCFRTTSAGDRLDSTLRARPGVGYHYVATLVYNDGGGGASYWNAYDGIGLKTSGLRTRTMR